MAPDSNSELTAVEGIPNEDYGQTTKQTFEEARSLFGTKKPALKIERESKMSAQNHAQWLKRQADRFLTPADDKKNLGWLIVTRGSDVYVELRKGAGRGSN